MEQQNDLETDVCTDTHAVDSSVKDVESHIENRSLLPSSVSVSEPSSVLHTTGFSLGVPSPPSSLYDSLPRPHNQLQSLASGPAMDTQMQHIPSQRSFRESSTSALNPSASEDDVSSRLFQSLPQLGLGQILHDLNNQMPPWSGFASERRTSGDVEEVEATERLLSSQGGEEGGEEEESSSRVQRRLSSGALIYSMSSNGDLETSDSNILPQLGAGTGAENSATATFPSTLSVETSTQERRHLEDESDDQTAVDELQALFRRCHSSLPFVALFVLYFAYQHAIGILAFVVGTLAVMGLDQRMREQVAMKDKANTWYLLGIVATCAINMIAICYVDGEPNPLHHFSQIIRSKTNEGSDSGNELQSTGGIFWQVLWTVLVNGTFDVDFLIRLSSVVVKAFVAGAKSDRFQCERKVRNGVTTSAVDSSPSPVVADDETNSTTTVTPLAQQTVSTVAFYRRKRKLYGIIEMGSLFLRSLLASIPWCNFYQLCASKFMADMFTVAYLSIKGFILANQGKRIFILARSFVTLGLEFGVYVSHDELMEAGSPDCSICYESMNQPVKLACSHMFCEECVTEWFDHERSCPLCRASVRSSGSTEAVNMKPQFFDGRTSLVPQLL